MTIIWREDAIRDLEQIDKWLTTFESGNPEAVRAKIDAALGTLDRVGDMGRPGRVEGTREIATRGAPYIIVYRMEDGDVEIVHIYHMSENR